MLKTTLSRLDPGILFQNVKMQLNVALSFFAVTFLGGQCW